MIDKGVYSQNDGRDYLGMSLIEGGDRHWVNAAYIPLDKVDEVLDKRGAATPPQQQTAPANTLTPIFRDAIGRTLARKKDRDKAVPMIFDNVLLGIGMTDADFRKRYLAALAERSKEWEEQDIESIVIYEFARAIREQA